MAFWYVLWTSRPTVPIARGRRSRVGMVGSESDVARGEVDVSALRLADLIAPDLDLLFVGFNPSVYSAIHGHFYARPGNRFWLLLGLAGLTPRRYAPEEDATLLDLRIGITDLCPVPTPGIADVPRALAESGRGALTAKIERYAPGSSRSTAARPTSVSSAISWPIGACSRIGSAPRRASSTSPPPRPVAPTALAWRARRPTWRWASWCASFGRLHVCRLPVVLLVVVPSMEKVRRRGNEPC